MNIPNYQSGAAAPVQARDPWDILEGGGGPKAIKFGERDQFNRFVPAPIGTSYTGILVEDLRSSVITDFETGEPERWPDGRFKEQIIAVVQTDLRDDEEDNGHRRIFFKGQMFTALQTELREKKTGRIGIGTRLTVTLVDLKAPTNPMHNPQNIFRVDVGPEIAPWVPEEQRAVDATLGITQGTPAQATAAAAAAGFPTQAQVTQAFPLSQAVVQPAVQAAVSPAVAAVEAIAAQGIPAPAAEPLALVTPVDVANIQAIMRAGLAKDAAISNYAASQGKGPDFIAALATAVPEQ